MDFELPGAESAFNDYLSEVKQIKLILSPTTECANFEQPAGTQLCFKFNTKLASGHHTILERLRPGCTHQPTLSTHC